MVDLRFNGEELILYIEKNTTLEELQVVLDEKLSTLKEFNSETSKVSVWFDSGIEQPDLLVYVVEQFTLAQLPVKAFYFEKPTSLKRPQPAPVMLKTHIAEPEKPTRDPYPEQIKVIDSTVRSGFSITHDGHILILGNTHKGSEVVATGSIIVCGEVQGSLKAGASDPERAFIVANQFSKAFLQIGEVYANGVVGDTTSMGVLKNGRIHIIPITNQEIVSDFKKSRKGESA
jgi:septum site-determining protein MinC